MIDSDIKNNLDSIYERVEAAAAKSGRTAEDIKVIAVTKTVDTDRIKNVLDYGIFDLGENRVQELMEKYDKLDSRCNWHLIGHLQTNKVKYIVDKVKMIHSVDSIDLAREINGRAARSDRKMDILLQVNVAGEESKFGIGPDEVKQYIEEISRLGNISLKGLMTIAPYAQNAQDIRPVFRKLYNIYIDIKNERIDNPEFDS